jgi:hypothetical protein
MRWKRRSHKCCPGCPSISTSGTRTRPFCEMGLTYVSRGFIPCRTLATRRARSQSRLYRRSARCRWPEAAADASHRIDEHSAVVASPCSTTIECPSCKASSAASVFCASFELRKISFQPGPESCPRHVRDVTPPSCADAAVTAAESFTQSPRKSMPSHLSGPLTVPAARTWCRRAAQRKDVHAFLNSNFPMRFIAEDPRKISARARARRAVGRESTHRSLPTTRAVHYYGAH